MSHQNAERTTAHPGTQQDAATTAPRESDPRRGQQQPTPAQRSKRDSDARRSTPAAQAVLDAALVVAFAVVGRASHSESLDPAGVLTTAWPFLAGLGLGWLAVRAWRHPHRLAPQGLIVWVVTVAAGMGLRVGTGGGFAVAFLVVASLFLALTILGGRAALGAATRRR
ncbi:DUF3054 domain-containing protein [Falsarthrobacter nasiphocae]|uniref:Peptidoglycan/LPS O-acetylase OafA/YrhL n=1 Tax=Falsarthrobacter nasiphocae TaxID=189863 RepID=A0AAE3YFB2_9MICC|nr:DUF3054 domain-containing protein [Falsarthrobacter nasiphocae]MDR6891094.1 peptidoglycan/LPS O-acetylase OafA/YrhL [Falsarthrobacter nasiphocae]